MTPAVVTLPAVVRFAAGSPAVHARKSVRLLAAALVMAAGMSSIGGLAQDAAPTDPAATALERSLSAEVVYRLLVADIALQRGEAALSARAYYEAAVEAREPVLARRATELALASRQNGIALEAAKLWSELEPDAERPRQVAAALAAGNAASLAQGPDHQPDFKAQLTRLLADAANRGNALPEAFLQVNRLLASTHEPAAALKLITTLAEPYPNVAEAHFAVALAAYQTGLNDMSTVAVARKAVDRALVLRPDWDRAVLLKGEILGQQSAAAAIEWLAGYVAAHPDARPVVAALGQRYVDEKRYDDARKTFEHLLTADPKNRDVRLALAALAMQAKDWDRAEKELTAVLPEDEDGTVALSLAQVAEESNRLPLAIERYGAVPEGERAWIARLRIPSVMAKMGRLDEARRYLADLPAVTIEQRVQVRQAEAQLLREAGDSAGAYAVLNRALEEHPDDPDILYDVAMVAEKLGKVEETEARLKRLLELKPDSAHALNALGYTLVDRTSRHAEGLQFIERAHKLLPEDAFILDSMGWALFRLHRLEEAEDFLRRALSARPDAEIAAHLGEVLWARGERERAREIWQSQLKASPDNPVLLETVRRFAP